MTESSYPFEDTDVSETQFARWARAIVGNGIVEGLSVTPDTGMSIIVETGSAMVRGVFYENDANKSINITAAPASGQTRKDSLVLRLDFSANSVQAVIVEGTATTGGGTLPSLTQNVSTWEHPIAEVSVVGGTATISTGGIKWLSADVGQRVVAYPDQGRRPTPTTDVAIGLNLDTLALEVWDGSSWTTINRSVDWGNVEGKPSTFPASSPNDADTIDGRNVFVQSSAPSSGVTNGDLWFQT